MKSSARNLFRRWRALPRLAWHYRARRSRRLPYRPLRLWIEPTNACNLRCPFCPTGTAPDEKRGLMDFDLYRKIIDEVAGYAVDVNLHHRGESLLHPRIVEMAALASRAGLRVRLHTNATALGPALGLELLRAGLWTISFSIDAATESEYEGLRVGGRFPLVVDNIRRFLDRWRGLPLDRRPRTIVEAMAVSATPPRQLKRELAELFAASPPDRIVVKRPHNWGGAIDFGFGILDFGFPPDPNPVAGDGDPCRERQGLEERLKSKIQNPKSKIPTCVCTLPWYALAIFWDGRVFPCPQDYYGKLLLGDCRWRRIEEIWNDEPAVTLRDRLARRDVAGLDPCQGCDRIRRRTVLGVPADFAARFLREYTTG